MLSDIEIAQAAKMQPITEIAANLGLQGEDVIPYGHYKAKLNHKLAKADKPEGKLILVTAIHAEKGFDALVKLRLVVVEKE